MATTTNQASPIGETRAANNNTWIIVSIGILLLLILMTVFGGGDRDRDIVNTTPGVTTGAGTGADPGVTGNTTRRDTVTGDTATGR